MFVLGSVQPVTSCFSFFSSSRSGGRTSQLEACMAWHGVVASLLFIYVFTLAYLVGGRTSLSTLGYRPTHTAACMHWLDGWMCCIYERLAVAHTACNGDTQTHTKTLTQTHTRTHTHTHTHTQTRLALTSRQYARWPLSSTAASRASAASLQASGVKPSEARSREN